MKESEYKALISALHSAAEMIRGQHETGGDMSSDEYTHDEYVAASKKAFKKISAIAIKYQHKLLTK